MGDNQTSWGTSDALTVKLYDAESSKVYRRAGQKEFFKANGLISSGMDKPVVLEKTLQKEKGDRVTKAFVRKQSDDGMTEQQVNLSKADGITSYTQNTTLDRRIKLIRVPAPATLSIKRIQMNLPMEARELLSDWLADFKDRKKFAAFSSSPTDIYYYDTNGDLTHTTSFATAKAGIVAASLFEPEMIDAACTNLRYRRVPGINIGGKQMYIAILSMESMFDLRRNSEWTQAQREARERGKNNPIFTNAEAVWNNCIIYSHDGITTGTDGGGASVNYSQNLVMGSQAMLWADGSPQPIEVIPDNQSANENIVYKLSVMWGVTKAQFNSEDLSVITLVCAHTAGLGFESALKETSA